jgi:hypothetical protein
MWAKPTHRIFGDIGHGDSDKGTVREKSVDANGTRKGNSIFFKDFSMEKSN